LTRTDKIYHIHYQIETSARIVVRDGVADFTESIDEFFNSAAYC
jgi:hypothetical protein